MLWTTTLPTYPDFWASISIWMQDHTFFAAWFGAVAGVFSIAVAGTGLWEKIKHRKPRLKIELNWFGYFICDQRPGNRFGVVFHITNQRKHEANILFRTWTLKILHNVDWVTIKPANENDLYYQPLKSMIARKFGENAVIFFYTENVFIPYGNSVTVVFVSEPIDEKIQTINTKKIWIRFSDAQDRWYTKSTTVSIKPDDAVEFLPY